jgi:hypothetical protein
MDRTIDELIAHIVAQVAARKPVRLSPESAQIIVRVLQADAVRRRAQTWDEDLAFEIAVWGDRDQLVEVIARVSNLTVARAAFRGAVIQRPGKRVLLKQRAWVLADSANLEDRDSQSA